MDASICHSCREPKGVHSCGACQSAICKKCVQRIEENTFSFLEKVPDELTHRTYCGPCYSEKIEPALVSYRQIMRRAKAVFVFFKPQGEKTRLMKRSEKPLHVMDCSDRDETLLRLAFLAAKAGFNALIDVSLSSKKIRNFGYQTLKWDGTGVPTQVDGEKLERESNRR